MMKNYEKYRPYQTIHLPDRQWPDKRIEKAPEWCSVDLRDGNQALEIPMNLNQKLFFFKKLVEMGFKTIEIGFPAASDTEYEFTRYLIENDLIPDDVFIQVLTQSRPHIIERTFEALKGCKNAVVHLYNSTSTLQREVVFGMNQEQCMDLAVRGAKQIKELAEREPQIHFVFEYSPESFTGTEMDFAVRICDAVCDVWQPTPKNKAIINLPATVEMSTPNVYADQIEYFCRNTRYRDAIFVSLHAHNDRGTAVAATELGLLAGADRVEGTLFGNGERTGNADLVTLALNLFSQGIDPKLDFSNINELIEIYEEATHMLVSPRHPYAGALVYTAFSGSHQDAIKKGLAALQKKKEPYWEVPYLPIDPHDVGRSYEPIIRINSQSGKGGVAYILEQYYGLLLPKPVQQAFSQIVTRVSDHQQRELKPDEIYQLFMDTYVNLTNPIMIKSYREEAVDEQLVRFTAILQHHDKEVPIEGTGNGLLDAFCQALRQYLNSPIEITAYHEHALDRGSTSKAITYVQIQNGDHHLYIGAGVSSSISRSSLRAVVSGVNQMLLQQQKNKQAS